VSIEERPHALRAFRDHLPDIQPSRDTPVYAPMNDSNPRLDTARHRILSPCHGTPRASTSVEAIATAAGPGLSGSWANQQSDDLQKTSCVIHEGPGVVIHEGPGVHP
jgi:hypothetical protein